MAIIEMTVKGSPRSPKAVLVIHGSYDISYNHDDPYCAGLRIDPSATITIRADHITDVTKLKEDIRQGETSPTKAMLNAIYGYGGEMCFNESTFSFKIKKVIFNGPATIVFFSDGKKEVVKQDPNSNEPFDPQKAVLYAFMKHVSKASSPKLWDNNLKMVESSLPLAESEGKQTKKSCNNCSKRQICAGFIFGDYWCWSPIKSEE